MTARGADGGGPVFEAGQGTGQPRRLDPERRVCDLVPLRDGTVLAELRVPGAAEPRCPPARPAERPATGGGVRLVDVVRDLAAAHDMPPERAGARVTAALRAWPTEPTPEEAWVVDEWGQPERRKVAETIVDPTTKKPGTREIALRVRLEDLARAAEPWRTVVYLDHPEEIAYWEIGYAPARFYGAPRFLAAVLAAAGIPWDAPGPVTVEAAAPVVPSPEPPAPPTPGFPAHPDTWAQAALAAAQMFWRAYRHWPKADEVWTQLASTPPPGFPVVSDPNAPNILTMKGGKPIARRAFMRRWDRWSAPRAGP